MNNNAQQIAEVLNLPPEFVEFRLLETSFIDDQTLSSWTPLAVISTSRVFTLQWQEPSIDQSHMMPQCLTREAVGLISYLLLGRTAATRDEDYQTRLDLESTRANEAEKKVNLMKSNLADAVKERDEALELQETRSSQLNGAVEESRQAQAALREANKDRKSAVLRLNKIRKAIGDIRFEEIMEEGS